MSDKPQKSGQMPTDTPALRKRAEAQARTMEPPALPAQTPEEIRQMLHELHVHQIELTMQNEELRVAQAELEASRERYSDLYDLAPVGYCTLSEKGLILKSNLTAATLLGAARSALVKQPINHFILKEDQDIYYLHRKKLFETGAPQVCELQMVKQDGTSFWAYLTATAAQDADGATVCRCVLNDISERKRAEEALYKSESMTQALLNGIPESAFLIESDGSIIAANTTVAQRLNCPMAELIGSNIFTRVPNKVAEFRRNFLDQAIQTGKHVQFEDVRSGRHIENRINPILDQDGKVTRLAIVGIDITERRRAEETLRESRNLLDATQRLAEVGGWEWDVAAQMMSWTDEAYR